MTWSSSSRLSERMALALLALVAATVPGVATAAAPNAYGEWQTLGKADGLPSDKVFCVLADGPVVWAGTENGLARLEGQESLTRSGDHPLLASLRERQGAGLVIFSSGSTGRAKAILHDVDRFLRKYETPGKGMRTLAFLLFDHVAGMDTLFYTLCNGGSLVLPEEYWI